MDITVELQAQQTKYQQALDLWNQAQKENSLSFRIETLFRAARGLDPQTGEGKLDVNPFMKKLNNDFLQTSIEFGAKIFEEIAGLLEKRDEQLKQIEIPAFMYLPDEQPESEQEASERLARERQGYLDQAKKYRDFAAMYLRCSNVTNN